MAFVLNLLSTEKGVDKKPHFGYLPPKRKTKKKGTDLEDLADEYMQKDACAATADKYGVNLELRDDEVAEDMPNADDDDGYYTHLEKQLYERPRPHTQKTTPPIRWQKGSLLGVGAYGQVHLGLNLDTGELIAVKQISLEGQQDKEVEAIEYEVRLLRNLRHENIVQYFGTSVEENTLNIFLEYVPGGSISSLLQKFGKFSEQVIQVYTKQILLGLEYLHRHQIVHRDIKGANILVDNSGIIKLADFGASKTIEGLWARNNASLSGIKGTPVYMAPEVIKQLKHGRQADIWSVGCTVVEMATGLPPWHEFTDQVSALFHIGSSNSIPTLPDWLSAPAKDFLLQCFRRDPKKRPTATKLLDHPFFAGLQIPTSKSPSVSQNSSEASSVRSSPNLSRVPSHENLRKLNDPNIALLRNAVKKVVTSSQQPQARSGSGGGVPAVRSGSGSGNIAAIRGASGGSERDPLRASNGTPGSSPGQPSVLRSSAGAPGSGVSTPTKTRPLNVATVVSKSATPASPVSPPTKPVRGNTSGRRLALGTSMDEPCLDEPLSSKPIPGTTPREKK